VQESLELLKQFAEETPQQTVNNNNQQKWRERSYSREDEGDFENQMDGLFEDIGETISSALETAADALEEAFDGGNGFEINLGFGGGRSRNKETIDYISNPITGTIPAIKLMGKNAPVEIYGYDGNEVRIEVKFNPKKRDARVLVQETGGSFEVLYDYNAMRWLGIECHVPNVLIDHIHGESKNSKVELRNVMVDKAAVLISRNSSIKIADVVCPKILAKTNNSNIYARNVQGSEIDLQTSNSKISVENIKARVARLTTSNSKVETENIDVVELYVKSSNGMVKLDDIFGGGPGNSPEERGTVPLAAGSQYPPGDPRGAAVGATAVGERIVDVQTSNATISVAVPKDAAVKLQASTSNGGVQCKLPNLIANEVSKNYFNGMTYGYDAAPKRVKLNLNTSNATVKIKEI